MSLNILSDLDAWCEAAFDQVENAPDGSARYRLKSEANAYIVLGSQAVGIGVLDESTADEYLRRLQAWEAIDGPWLYMPGDDGELVPVPVTMDALRPYFGTRTNVFPKVSTRSFNARVKRAQAERDERKARQTAAQ